jgi:hypothetical protein
MNIRAFSILALMSMPTLAYSQSSLLNPEEQALQNPQAAQRKNYAVILSSSINSNFYKDSSINKTYDMDFYGSFSLISQSGYRTTLTAGGNKNLKGERKYLWQDYTLGVSKAFYRNKYYGLSGSMVAIIPASKQTLSNQKLYAGLQIAPTFSSSFNIDPLLVTLRPAVRVNFHEHKTAMDGRSNNRYNTSLRLSVFYNFTDQLSLLSINTYSRNFTYQGKDRDAYSFIQALSYQLDDLWNVEVGHATSGNPLAPNGLDTDITIFDLRESSVYLSFSLSF